MPTVTHLYNPPAAKEAYKKLPQSNVVKRMFVGYENMVRLTNPYHSEDRDAVLKAANEKLRNYAYSNPSIAKTYAPNKIEKIIIQIMNTVAIKMNSAFMELNNMEFWDVGKLGPCVFECIKGKMEHLDKAKKIAENAAAAGQTKMNDEQQKEFDAEIAMAEEYEELQLVTLQKLKTGMSDNIKIADEAGKGDAYRYLHGIPDDIENWDNIKV